LFLPVIHCKRLISMNKKQLINPIVQQAYHYLKRIPSSVVVKGENVLLKNMKATHSAEQQKDCLSSFILATLLAPCAEKLVFEENCKQHPSKGPHDLVVYLNGGTRIVNEIKRLKPTFWDRKETECARNSVKRTGALYEVKEDPNRSTTGFLDTILKEVESKGKQLDPNNTNIIWFSSIGTNHYEANDIEDVASHYTDGHAKLSSDQPGRAHEKPEWLTALGWFFDGDPQCTSLNPKCFFLVASVVDKMIGKTLNVDVNRPSQK